VCVCVCVCMCVCLCASQVLLVMYILNRAVCVEFTVHYQVTVPAVVFFSVWCVRDGPWPCGTKVEG
jgi:hypothetical protein